MSEWRQSLPSGLSEVIDAVVTSDAATIEVQHEVSAQRRPQQSDDAQDHGER